MKIVFIRSNDFLGGASRQVQTCAVKELGRADDRVGLHIYNPSTATSTF